MKIFKKFRLGLLAPALLFTSLASLVHPGTASASALNGYVPQTNYQIKNVSLKFGSDRSTIIATFPTDTTVNPSVPGGTVTLQDGDPTDTTFRYTPTTDFCHTGDAGGIWFNHSGNGVTASNISSGPNQTFGNTVTAYVDLDYLPRSQTPDTSNLGNCNNTNPLAVARPVSNASVLNYSFAWQGGSDNTQLTTTGPIGAYPGVTSSYKDWVFSPTGLDNTLVYGGQDSTGNCPDVAIISNNNSTGDIYVLSGSRTDLSGNTFSTDANSVAALKNEITKAGQCWVVAKNGVSYDSSTVGKSYQIAGKRGTLPSQGGDGSTAGSATGSTTGNTPNSTGDDASTCELSASNNSVGGQAESFFMCPMIDAADKAANGMTELIRNLLSFRLNESCSSGSLGSQCSSVKTAWAEIRDLSSILLVIIMLVMVLSQAISFGPFDAYTVRKILPRLVIAVIAMQLSWSLLSWAVNVFDDLGKGVQDLLFAPFPSGLIDSNGMPNLGFLLGNANIGTVFTGIVSWTAVVGVFALSVLSLPTILLMAWSVVLAILVGVVVLTFRQIFLVALLIFAPLAILLWILPNTQRYWKLWYDNFTKLLLMFPMIMGLLAVGAIFALIASEAKHTELLAFLLILIGYFGPYFMLPKTYKWGGQALAAASGAIQSAAPKLGGPVTNYLKGEQSRSRWTLSRKARVAELERRASLRNAQGLQMEGALRHPTTWVRGARGSISRARTAGLRSVIPRGPDQAVRQSIAERAGTALEEDMSKDVKRENLGDVNAFLASNGNADAWITAENAKRTAAGRPVLTAPEEQRVKTNFQRFDQAGWRDNRIFASAATKFAGEAGFLDPTAVAQAKDIYTDAGRNTDAVARWTTIEDGAVRDAAKAGQIGVPGIGSLPYQQAWRGVSDLGQVSQFSMGNVIGRAAATANGPATGFGAELQAAHTAGAYTPTTYTAGVGPGGTTLTFNAVRFNDQRIQTMAGQLARVRAGEIKDPNRRQAIEDAYAEMRTTLSPAASADLENLVQQMADYKFYG